MSQFFDLVVLEAGSIDKELHQSLICKIMTNKEGLRLLLAAVHLQVPVTPGLPTRYAGPECAPACFAGCERSSVGVSLTLLVQVFFNIEWPVRGGQDKHANKAQRPHLGDRHSLS